MDNYMWHSCPKGERYRHISKFMHMKPEELASLHVSELVFLLQWAFELKEKKTVQANVREEYFDLRLVSKQKEDRREYARFYLERPISAVYKLTTELRGRRIDKIYLFTFDKFGPADQKAQKESPLFIELREGEGLIHWVQGAQERYRKMLHIKQSYYVIPEPFSKRKSGFEKLWSELKQKIHSTSDKVKTT